MTRSTMALGIFLTCAMFATGCSDLKPYEPHKERKNFFYPTRQNAPEPVYNRVKLVHLPSPLPGRSYEREGLTPTPPLLHLELIKASLEEAAQALATANNYSSYCSSFIAKRPITIDVEGTVEEIADKIAVQEHINAIVDHENHEIRFIADTSVPVPSESASNQDVAVPEPQLPGVR